jgi:Flp pilus assembly protein TadG
MSMAYGQAGQRRLTIALAVEDGRASHSVGRRAVMKRLKRQEGSNLVEFALVLPLLLILVMGIVEVGLAIYDKAVITNACREGARAGIIFREQRLTTPEIQTVVQNYAGARLVTFSTTPALTVTPLWDDVDLNGVKSSGDTLTVTVSYQYDYLMLGNFIPGLGTLNLQSTSVMRYE